MPSCTGAPARPVRAGPSSTYLTDGTAQPAAWGATAGNGSGSPQTLRTFVLCASP